VGHIKRAVVNRLDNLGEGLKRDVVAFSHRSRRG
jgi:hypothetical protein